MIQRFLDRLTGEVALKKYVMSLSELHMKPNRMVEDRSQVKSFMKLFDDCVCPDDLLLLSRADYVGRQAAPEDGARLAADYAPTEQRLRDLLGLYRERMAKPYLMGRDLIDAGVRPGPEMGEALAFAHKLRLAGISKEDQLRQALGYLRSLRNGSKAP